MNILLITTHLNYGGITSYIKSLAKGLKARGYNLSIASSGGDCLDFFQNLGIEHIFIPIRTKSEISPKILFSFIKLLPILKKKKIQIIHSNTRVTQVLSFLLSKFTNISYISTCHGFFKSRIFRRLFGFWGDGVIAISDSVKRHLMEDFKVKEDKISLIYHGIDLNKFKIQNLKSKTEIKKEMGLKEAKVIGIVARLSEEKGHIYLIHSFKMVKEEYPSLKLLVVGEGKIKHRLLKLVEEIKVKEDVLFLPSVSDTSKILRAIDIFCLPSLKEGLGLSLMEAQAMGIPVIASRVGGVTNLIEDQKTGLLVEKADVKGLASAILKLLKNEDLAKDMGRKAKEFIEKNFSLEKMIDKTESLYKRCLKEN